MDSAGYSLALRRRRDSSGGQGLADGFFVESGKAHVCQLCGGDAGEFQGVIDLAQGEDVAWHRVGLKTKKPVAAGWG